MKTTNINGVELTEDPLKILQRWQEKDGMYLAQTLQKLSDLKKFKSES